MNTLVRLLALASLVALRAFAQDSAPDLAGVAKKLAPSLVKVEYELQSDKGDTPRSQSWGERCPNCGQIHGNGLDEYVRQERAVEASGVVLGAREVVAQDVELHPRFIKSIKVRRGDKSVPATIKSFARDHDAVLLELAEPLADSKPLAFDAAKKGPYFAASYKFMNGDWQTHLTALGSALTLPENAKPFIAAPSFAVVTDKSGNAVGLCTKSELPPDASWKGSPQKWTFIPAADMAARLAKVEKDAQAVLLRVHLTFRSPKTTTGGGLGGFGPGCFGGGRFGGGGAYFTSAHGRLRPMQAIWLGAQGDITPPELGATNAGIAWSHPRRGSYMQTPTVVGGHVFGCADKGVLTCFDAKSGEVKCTERLVAGGQGHTASPVSDGRHLFFASEIGNVFVVPSSGAFSIVATNAMGETCMATPAIAGGTLLLRTGGKVVAIGAK
jgi:hypothetical protein